MNERNERNEPKEIIYRVIQNAKCAIFEYKIQKQKTNEKLPIYAFDMDDTLTASLSKKVYKRSENDWKWLHPDIPVYMRTLEEKGHICIFTNQSTYKKDGNIRKRIENVIRALDIPIVILVAIEKDVVYRKPNTGMWNYYLEYCHEKGMQVDIERSCYVGDAGGRPDDHSACDRHLAENIGIPHYFPETFFPFLADSGTITVPEEEFVPRVEADNAYTSWNEVYNVFIHVMDKNEKLMVLMVGPPAVGKTSIYKHLLQPFGFTWINQDTYKTKARCMKALDASKNNRICIDMTNPDKESRAIWIEWAHKNGYHVCICNLSASWARVQHQNSFRCAQSRGTIQMIPDVVYRIWRSKYMAPTYNDALQIHVEILEYSVPVVLESVEDKELYGKWYK